MLLTLFPQRHLMALELKDVTLHGDKGKLIQLMKTLLTYVISAAPRGSTVSVMPSLFIGSMKRTSTSRSKSKKPRKFLKICISCRGDDVDLVSEIVEYVTLSFGFANRYDAGVAYRMRS